MALLQKIKTISRRIYQLEGGTGNNQPARASDVNPIIQWVNDRSDVNTATNAVTSSGGTINAQTGTINAISGTITTATLTTTAANKTTITITDAYCTANSTVMAVIANANVGTGAVYIASVVPAAGSFVITLVNGITLTGTPTAVIKFVIL
jgi:hypothetical protein